MEMIKKKIIKKVQNCNNEAKLKKIYQFVSAILQ